MEAALEKSPLLPPRQRTTWLCRVVGASTSLHRHVLHGQQGDVTDWHMQGLGLVLFDAFKVSAQVLPARVLPRSNAAPNMGVTDQKLTYMCVYLHAPTAMARQSCTHTSQHSLL